MQLLYQIPDNMLYFKRIINELQILRKRERNMQASSVGAVFVLVVTGIYLICRLVGGHFRLTSRTYDREKDQLMRKQIETSLEKSAPIHLDIGSCCEGGLAGGASFAAAEATGTVSAQMAFADEPWVITAGGGLDTALEKDAVRTGMEAADYGSSYDPDCSIFTGTGDVEHAAGNSSQLEKEPNALHLSIGSAGPASAALCDPLYSKGDILCVGGDDLLAQAIACVSADAVFVGEQYTEISDSLDNGKKNNPALIAADILRWVIIAAVVLFAAAGLRGI